MAAEGGLTVTGQRPESLVPEEEVKVIRAERDPLEAPFFLSQLYFGSRIIPVSTLGPITPTPGAQSTFHAVEGKRREGEWETWPALRSHWNRKNPGSPRRQGSPSCVPGPVLEWAM